MALSVGRIPDFHTEPFYFDMQRRGIALYEMMPSALAAAVIDGEIAAAPLPLVDCLRLADALRPVAGFCVASVQKTGAALLYSTKPIADLTGAHLGITDEDPTAVQLLDVLLRLKYQVQPAAYVPLPAAHEAFLLSGNDAIRRRGGARGFPHTYDLSAEWHAWTGLPFVFSRWMVRQDLDPKALALLQDTLYVGLEEGVDALYQTAEPREDLLMLPRDIVRYVRGFRYYIGLSEQQAIEQFRHCLQQLDGLSPLPLSAG
jgi:predicted solute-binding protein